MCSSDLKKNIEVSRELIEKAYYLSELCIYEKDSKILKKALEDADGKI